MVCVLVGVLGCFVGEVCMLGVFRWCVLRCGGWFQQRCELQFAMTKTEDRILVATATQMGG